MFFTDAITPISEEVGDYQPFLLGAHWVGSKNIGCATMEHSEPMNGKCIAAWELNHSRR